MNEYTRSFLALLLPPELISAATEIQETLRERFPPGAIKWVDPELFHLTVRFFGDLDRTQIERAATVVRELDRNFPRVAVRSEGVSAFPSAARPQTLWIAVQDRDGKLDRLAATIDRKIQAAGFGPADKPWTSHLTIGRAHRGARIVLDPGWTRGLTWPGGHFTIQTVALMKSELRPQGPRYTPLSTATAA